MKTKWLIALLMLAALSGSPARASNAVLACGGVDDTAVFVAWLQSAQTSGDPVLRAGPGRCRIKSPPPVITWPVNIEGAGLDLTVFERDYSAATGEGFIHLRENTRGSRLARVSVISAAGRSGGHALVIQSTASYTAGNAVVESVKFSSDGQNSWQTTVRLDGTLRLAEPRGVRAVTFSNVHIFGASWVSLELATVVGFSYQGGGVYAASGTSRASGGIQIRGTPSHPSQYVNVDISNVGILNLSDTLGASITASDIGFGNGWVIETAGSAINIAVRGQTWAGVGIPNGGVVSNWQGSSLTWPNGIIFR